MFGFIIFCVQIFCVQYAFSQTVAAPSSINNGYPASFGSTTLNAASLTAANMGPVLTGPMMASGISGATNNLMGPQAAAMAAGIPAANAANPFAGYIANYGGIGNGDVNVAGELPVAGTTAITGQVPMSGTVQFTGTLPAGGIVTISGQCGCATNYGPYNAPYAAKPGYNNNLYLY